MPKYWVTLRRTRYLTCAVDDVVDVKVEAGDEEEAKGEALEAYASGDSDFVWNAGEPHEFQTEEVSSIDATDVEEVEE